MIKIITLLLIFISFAAHAVEDRFNAFIYLNQNSANEGAIGIGIKDNIDVKGMATSAGSLALADYYPDKDAFLITKLKIQKTDQIFTKKEERPPKMGLQLSIPRQATS